MAQSAFFFFFSLTKTEISYFLCLNFLADFWTKATQIKYLLSNIKDKSLNDVTTLYNSQQRIYFFFHFYHWLTIWIYLMFKAKLFCKNSLEKTSNWKTKESVLVYLAKCWYLEVCCYVRKAAKIRTGGGGRGGRSINLKY